MGLDPRVCEMAEYKKLKDEYDRRERASVENSLNRSDDSLPRVAPYSIEGLDDYTTSELI